MNKRPRLPLSWRLCLSITFVVMAVMVAVSLPAQITHQREMDRMIEGWVRVAAYPLVQVLSTAEGSIDPASQGVARAVEEFRSGVGKALGRVPSVRIESDSGASSYGDTNTPWLHPVVIETAETMSEVSPRILLNRDELASPWDWSAYWLHVLVTTVALSGSLYWTLRFLIAQPLERLQDGVRLMEMGYWGEVEDTAGVWEIRWLSRRFRQMGLRLQKTVGHLAAAERRGVDQKGREQAQALPQRPLVSDTDAVASPVDVARLREGLLTRLQELTELSADTDKARALAQQVWEQDPSLAEQIGEIDLKTQIEDTAFQVMSPGDFVTLRKQLSDFVPNLRARAEMVESTLAASFNRDGVGVVRMERRLKGLGSIWRKMKKKDLTLPQIHDLLALRVVVPSTDECYRALHLVHKEFAPIVGRFKDYITDPKPNGYQSIHSTVRLSSGEVCEIQIRSVEMHQMAEAGDCAHWRYRLDT